MSLNRISLPYVDNVKAVLITIVINLGVVFIFFWPDGVTFANVIMDSLICAIITTAINMTIIYFRMKKMRNEGLMPGRVPESPFMQKLPKNPFALGVIYAIGFGAVITGINALVLWFFEMPEMAFVPWMIYKLIYTTLLSIKIAEFCIFRYVQPDWAKLKGPSMKQEAGEDHAPVKNPIPKVSMIKEIYGSVTANLAMNIIIGTALGGVVIGANYEVIVYPTTVQGIPITGLVFGFICGSLTTNGVLKSMKGTILAAGPDMTLGLSSDKRFTWMPKNPIALGCLVCICMMAVSSVVLWAIMMLFGISVMNFYQFTIFITIYATAISKPVSYILVKRCMQPTYIHYVLKKQDKRGRSLCPEK